MTYTLASTTENKEDIPLFRISLPLILSSLSTNLMIFFDRFWLANFKLEALSAVIASSILCFMFIEPINAIVTMSDAYIGRLNGSQRYASMGKYIWQMIWFSLATSVFFLAISIWGTDLLISKETQFTEDSRSYFKTLLWFGPFFPLNLALSAFFIGRNANTIILKTTILAHLINIFGDLVLIPGLFFFPKLGASGSAYSIGLATMAQSLILFRQFIKSSNHDIFATRISKFEPKLLAQGLKWGLPNAIIILLEYSAWASIINFMGHQQHHITVYGITESV
ncbi:MAG: MATE family efflux transporter, partial [Gammaproteobacteria bacterium]